MVKFTEVAEGALATEAATLATLEARAGALAVAFIGRGRRRTSLRQGGRLRIAEATAINVCLCPSGDPLGVVLALRFRRPLEPLPPFFFVFVFFLLLLLRIGGRHCSSGMSSISDHVVVISIRTLRLPPTVWLRFRAFNRCA